MSPRITLSIPEELSKKMEKYKEKFNYSRIFQEAISRKIRQKENFEKKINEDPEIETIIKRLREEKMNEQIEFYNIGKQDGLEWAKRASYRELKYVAQEHEAMFEFTDKVISYDPTRNEIMGDYFADILEEYKEQGMGFMEMGSSNCIPNDVFKSWEKGWQEAIKEFWEEIKNKI